MPLPLSSEKGLLVTNGGDVSFLPFKSPRLPLLLCICFVLFLSPVIYARVLIIAPKGWGPQGFDTMKSMSFSQRVEPSIYGSIPLSRPILEK